MHLYLSDLYLSPLEEKTAAEEAPSYFILPLGDDLRRVALKPHNKQGSYSHRGSKTTKSIKKSANFLPLVQCLEAEMIIPDISLTSNYLLPPYPPP